MNSLEKLKSSELAKSGQTITVDDWRKQIASENPELWEGVLFVLGLFQTAGILMQNNSKFSLDQPNQIAFYVKDCLDLGVTVQILMDHHNQVRRETKWWPTSGEFAKAFVQFRASTGLVPSEFVGYLVDKDIMRLCDVRTNPEAMTETDAQAKIKEYLRSIEVEVKALNGPPKKGDKTLAQVAKQFGSTIGTKDEDPAERVKRFHKQAALLARTG